MSDTLTPAASLATLVFSSAAPAAPQAASPATPPAAPTAQPAAPLVEHHSDSGLSPEAVKMAGWIREDLAKGKMTQADADKAFDDLGVPADQRVTTPDTRTDEQKLIDQHFPVAQPEEFRIAYANPGQVAPPMTKELQQFDTTARTWLAGAEFPASLGNSLISAITKTAQATKHLSADQLESYGLVEYAKLERVYGAELEDKLNAAGRLVAQLEKKTPGLKNLLRSKGLGDNAMVAQLLIQQAERYWLRRKGR